MSRAYERRRRIERKARGECIQCAEPANPPSVRCDACRLSNRIRARALYAERKLAGLCTKCGSQAFPCCQGG